MSWNSGPYPQGNQGYYGGPPPQQPYPGGYPGAPPSGYPGAPPPGYPGAPGAYPGQPGFNPPPPQPPYGNPYDSAPQQGEATPFNYHTGMYGNEDPSVKGFDFSDKSIRRGFIRKVYSILMVQLSISLGFIAWFLFHTPTRKFVQGHGELLIISLVIIFVTMIALACCGEVRRKSPMNYIFLFIFTLAESFVLAVCSSTYESQEVMMAVGITAAVCLGLTLFAFQTKYDFTMCGGILFVAVLILFIFGIVTIFVHTKVVKLVYASLGALIFSIYLVYDTQLMLGGNHKYSISPEEYVFAALNLYIDVINIFMYILTIIGTSRD
ncbi:protein lifeguard 1 isoform X1 [Tribolium madens]|uniref:protein lifeguard 1 isoform X1 n=2 Tax=Tribolium madens TaxID=41895 RepID=UPI001CF721E4|nr:protein lifeguard 1 isoform X1 [Tribolium madens]